MHDFAKRQRILEINPRSPLIEGLLRRVENLPTDEDEKDLEAEDELKEVIAILLDGALVRSGYEVPDSNAFFSRVDRVLRRSLGVSETAQADATVKPAPPVDPTVESDEEVAAEDDVPGIKLPDHLKDKVQIEMEEIPEDDPIHDEL
jgi:heat shock protein beta